MNRSPKLHKTILLSLCLLLTLTFAATSNAEPWKTFTLDNGLNVLVKEMPSAPVVAINIWVHVGSRNEKSGEEGYSHLIEHMMFKGTPTYPTGQLDKEIKKMGVKQNAFTGPDYTCYHVLGAKEHFSRLMELEADAALNSSFDEKELEKEIKVVIEELRMGKDDPERYLYNLTRETSYLKHPYHHPVVGYESNIASCTRESIFSYYKRYYVPSNMWVVVVGDVKAEDALAAVQLTMGKAPKVEPPNQKVEQEPKQDRKREVVKYGDIKQAYVNLVWHVPGIESTDNYVIDLITSMLGVGRSSRLHKTLVEDEGLVTSVNASYFTFQDPSLFMVHAQMPQGNVRKFIDRATKIVYELKEGLIKPEEFEKAKQQIVALIIFSRETAEEQAFSYGHHAILGKLEECDANVDRIKQISLEDIQRIAKTYFSDTGLTTVSYEPQIATETQKPEMITLDNGLKLILKENHFSPLVGVAIQFDAGGLREGKNEAGVANLTASMLMKGTEGKSADEIAKAFEAMGTQVSFTAMKSYTNLKMQLLTEKFIPSLELALEILTKASFPDAEFKKEQAKALEMIKAEEDDLFQFTYTNTLSALYPDYQLGYSTLGTVKDVKNMKRSDLTQFFKKHYVGSGMTVAIVGDFFISEMKDKLIKMFSEIPQGNIPEFKERNFPQIEKPTEVLGKKNREQVQVMVATRTFPRSDPKTPPMDILKNILSGSMSSRLFVNLRQKQSLAYTVFCYNVGSKMAGYFFATLSTKVSNLDKAKEGLIKELDDIRLNGFTDDEFADAKKYIIGQYALSLVDNVSQANVFSADEFFGLGYDYFQKYPELIKKTTKESVNDISKEYLLGSGSYVIGITKP